MDTKLKEAVGRVTAFLDARRRLDPKEQCPIASQYTADAKSNPLRPDDLRALVDAVQAPDADHGDIFDLIREWAALPEGGRHDAARAIIGRMNKSYAAGVADGKGIARAQAAVSGDERAAFDAAWPDIRKHGDANGWHGVALAAWMTRAAFAYKVHTMGADVTAEGAAIWDDAQQDLEAFIAVHGKPRRLRTKHADADGTVRWAGIEMIYQPALPPNIIQLHSGKQVIQLDTVTGVITELVKP